MITANEKQKKYRIGDEVLCYQTPADELEVKGGHLDVATITGPREAWTGNPISSKYGYPIKDSLGREGWIFENQIINQQLETC